MIEQFKNLRKRICAHRQVHPRSFYCEKCFELAEELVNNKEIEEMWKRGSDAFAILAQEEKCPTNS